ncbi:hypothetical protein JK159_02580 [Weissella minor]|uniref:hypothetical protein n=1 Tax=Weissella minor TaxID=1620 RepID=UPI001BAF30B1|nr:hypothetical protein [Weissella minor]MBS0949270.1 hypothetical protein [Weissella minor]
MKIFILIATLIVILVLLTIFRRTGRRLTERQIISSQQAVNAAMNAALHDLDASLGVKTSDKQFRSTLVANIWGHEVMAFEFSIPIERAVNRDILRKQLNDDLIAYTRANGMKSFDANEPAMLITDLWFDNKQPLVHIDVAHICNAETLSYLHDLRCLNQLD